MVILGIILITMIFFFLLIFFSFIEVDLKNLNFSSDRIKEGLIDKSFNITLTMKFLKRITILKIELNKDKFKEKSIKENFNKIENRLREKDNLELDNITALKYLKISLKEFNLKVLIGIEDASINAIFVGLASTLISVALGTMAQNEDKYMWKVTPMYQRNVLKINLDCIFTLKLTHIIYTIYVLVKKGDKNGRTSNRRSYAYSNE